MNALRFPHRVHVLIVDDTHVNRLIGGQACELFGATTQVASGGREALALCYDQQFDIVLMDIRMPIMDGIEAALAIRALDGPNSKVPILAVTGDASADMRGLCFAVGMNGLVEKPIGLEDLFNQMTEALRLPAIELTSGVEQSAVGARVPG